MVMLSHPAPAGGVTVTLTTGAPSLVGLPGSVFIPEGGSSRAFTFTTSNVQNNVVVAIFGSFNGVMKRKDIVLVP